MSTYRIETLDMDTDRWTPQKGVPHVVVGFAGLRRALRLLRQCGYRARRGDPFVVVERVESEEKYNTEYNKKGENTWRCD